MIDSQSTQSSWPAQAGHPRLSYDAGNEDLDGGTNTRHDERRPGRDQLDAPIVQQSQSGDSASTFQSAADQAEFPPKATIIEVCRSPGVGKIQEGGLVVPG
jgi:hypothetical protein